MHTPTSPAKANRLYWLGRYAERVYTSLHIVHDYYDRMIDGDPFAYEEFCTQMGLAQCYKNLDAFVAGYLYDKAQVGSVAHSLNAANDNAILLREEIQSDSLSYIHLALSSIAECAQRSENNMAAMQSVTDNILAFWGSISEMVFDGQTLDFLLLGKHIEYIELHIRFHHDESRIVEAWSNLKQYATRQQHSIHSDSMHRFDDMLAAEYYSSPDGRQQLIDTLNLVVLV